LAASSRLVNLPVRLEHDVDAEVLPRQLRRVLHREHLELVAVHADAPPFASTVAVEVAEDRVVLEQVRQRGALVMSFTATKSMSRLPSAARMMLRPMRPNPLMPTLMAIECLPVK
jgi:hypothetical protein